MNDEHIGEGFTVGHKEKVEAAKVAIDKVFSDTSVSKEKTRDSLEEIVDHIEDKLLTLREEQ